MATNSEIKVNVTNASDKKQSDDLLDEFAEQVPESTPEIEPAKLEPTDESESAGPDNPIRFKYPVLINGVRRKELRWTDEITSEQFLNADSHAHGNRASNSIAEMDNGLHFWLGVMMIVAANPEIDPKDLEQIKGKDVAEVMRVGRFFMLPDADVD